ncbi:MAG TPA: carboxypeptidase-like regulatory domain-containing protein, partial [Terriglobia bacterium]|nr:carboxypeptidase-like regulatory domain-containing protein [Terriglobia bacterium]
MLNILVLAAFLVAQTPTVGTGRSGVIEGLLLSADGKPADGVRVAAVPGDPAPVSSPDSALFAISETDSSGHYRLEGLDPGRYRVVAGLLDFLTYYPGVKDGGKSTTIQVTDGSLRTGVDFTLQSPVGVRVSGRATRLNPKAILPRFVTMNNSSGNGSFQQLQVNVADDGSFEFSKVPPGSYQLRISPFVVGSPPVQISIIDKDVSGIEFQVPLITMVRGRVTVEDGSPAPRVTLGFVSSRGAVNAGVSADGSFSVQVPEGEQRVMLSGFPGAYSLKSIAAGSTNLLLSPLSVGESEIRDVNIVFTGPPPVLWLKVKGR